MINAIGIPLIGDAAVLSGHNDALAKAACLYGVPAYLYSLSDLSDYRKHGVLKARCWEGGEYHRCEIDCPKYSEITCCAGEIKGRFADELQWLTEHTVLTDAPALGKRTLQAKLQSSDLYRYAIPTIAIRSYEALVAAASGLRSSFLKPAAGRKAQGVMKLTSESSKIFYATPEGAGELTETVFDAYYSAAGYQKGSTLLLEPCLNILNDDGRAVDFRCLVSLNGEGKWQNVLTYARIGGSGVASNFSHGGSLNFAEDVLEALIPGHSAEKLTEINAVALKVAAFIQNASPKPVSWLGLDLCVDRPSNQIYVIEANSKPGTKLVGPWPLALVRAQYFKYLLRRSDKE